MLNSLSLYVFSIRRKSLYVNVYIYILYIYISVASGDFFNRVF